MKRNKFLAILLPTLAFTVFGFLVTGYHPGIEDDGVYLSAVKADIHPTLFSHDSDFFRVQLQATQFDEWMAKFVDTTHISVAWAELLWQFLSLFVILAACRSIAAQIFVEKRAQWAAVAMVSAMFTLPVAGTALYIVDQHLHPRAISTALILVAVSRILAGRRWNALPLLAVAMLMHPIMGLLGISFCCFLKLATLEKLPIRLRGLGTTGMSLMPLGWIFDAPTEDWREALSKRSYFLLNRWTWYELLGAVAPLVIFLSLWRFASRRGETRLAQFSLAIFAYGVFQFIVALLVIEVPAWIRLVPLQPMRFLHLIYIFLCLIGGGFLGRYVLQASVWRWAAFLLAANGGMLYAQQQLFPATAHLEMPWTAPSNAWLQAFDWVRQNTPVDAYFAVDPYYMAAPGEDFHSFRALAERSMLADAVKDTAVVTQVPRLAPVWHEQQLAMAGWSHFQLADFERLKTQFGVGWALVSYRAPAGLACAWHNGTLAVCKIP
ncbi:MAG TPA: DUF6798 domain-containing protein [Acidobacteriaceae bacterium]|nr:DUF6798 domain-containing protein [Acidobacteriaceae bacterium]